MAVDERAGTEVEVVEVTAEKPRRGPISYDAGLGPSCMIWGVVLGLAFLVGVELMWGIGHLDTIFR